MASDNYDDQKRVLNTDEYAVEIDQAFLSLV